MFNKLSNKELVSVTHDLAKTLGADTPLLDIAKLLAESATRLDVAIARGNELQRKVEDTEALMLAMRDDSRESRSKLELVVAENMALKKQSVRIFNSGYSRGHESTVEGDYVHVYRADEDSFHTDDVQELLAENTPATDAMVNEIRAEGVELYADATIAIGKSENDEAIIYAGNQALLFANKLRVDADKDGE